MARLAFLIWPVITGILAGILIVLLVQGANDSAGDSAPSRLGYADAVAKASASVVNIYTTRIVTTTPLAFFCRDPRNRELCEELGAEQRRMQNSLGSGVVVREDGYVLTNAHVIADADEILVALPNGSTTNASIVGTDLETDLALLKINRDALIPIQVADSNAVRVGDPVLAIGNPFGLGQTVSAGIVSAKGREGATVLQQYIQTDAAINPGNSGGALVDLDGQLVGINALIFSQSGDWQGISFAIPSTIAMNVMEDLISEGKVIRGFLGVEFDPEPVRFGRTLTAVLVNTVVPDGPADEAGVLPGDIILSINGMEARDRQRATQHITMVAPGSPIAMEVLRGQSVIELTAVAILRPQLGQ
ncbi:MAG: trypsin-like peptidase domain-containing protein [Pseudomonadales bacterium]